MNGRAGLRSLRGACLLLALLVSIAAAFAQADPMGSRVLQLKSPNASDRTAAAKFLIDNGTDSLPGVLGILAGLAPVAASPKKSTQELDSLLVITDVLRGIIANKEGAVRAFRSLKPDANAIQALIWAARSDNKDLRVNSTYVLASVVDNTSVCFVLHHLMDKTLSDAGRVNLLQVAAVPASYVYKDNFDAIQKTKAVLDETVKGRPDLAQTRVLTDQLMARAEQSDNKTKTLADADLPRHCGDYDYQRPVR